MRACNLFYALIGLLFALFLLGIGLFVFMIPKADDFRALALQLFGERSTLLSYVGFGLMLVGILLLIALYAINRRRNYSLKIGKNFVTVDEGVIQKYADQYWKELFAGAEVHTEVRLWKNQIHLAAELPSTPFEKQKELLQKIEYDLGDLFSKVLDYHENLSLSISFLDN